MKTVLIANLGEPYEADIRVIEFDDSSAMINYINKIGIRENKILGMYETIKKIEIEPVTKVTEFQIKE